MVVDPFSIAGAVGLAAGILGFLVSTLENTTNLIDRAYRHDADLKRYHQSLLSCKWRLYCWKQMWSPKVPSDTTEYLNFLWGSTGRLQIEDLAECVDREAEHVNGILRSCNGLSISNADRKQWQKLAEAIPASGELMQDTRHSWSMSDAVRLTRVMVNVLLKHSTIKDRIESLDRLINDLQLRSTIFYNQARELQDLQQPPAAEDIRAGSIVHTRVRSLREDMRAAHHRLVHDREKWALLLGSNGDLPLHLDFEEEDELHICFLFLRGMFRKHQLCHEIGFMYCWDQDIRHDIAQHLSTNLDYSDASSGRLGEPYKTIFWMIVDSPVDLQRNYRLGCRYDCAQAAVSVATWFTLSWRSNWMDCLCSCGIRSVIFPSGTRKAAFQRQDDHLMDGCSRQGFGQRQYLQLGLILCELALTSPITIQSEPENPELDFCVRRYGATSARKSLTEMLRLVRNCTSRDYRKAVEFCFISDFTHTRRPRSSGDVLMQNRKHIIAPLRRHCDVLSTHRDQHKRIYTRPELQLQRSLYEQDSRPGAGIEE